MIKNKRGISGVITAVIMIALVMATVVIVWVVVRNMVEGGLEDVESCFGSYGEVTINNRYVCYNSSSNQFQFSISIGDIDADSVIVSISGEGTTKGFEITSENQQIANLTNYGSTGFGTDNVTVPEKNGGKTYLTNYFTSQPDLIKIAPVISGKQCEVSDTLSDIDNCLALP